MKKLLYCTIHKSFPVDSCPEGGIPVKDEDEIKKFLKSLSCINKDTGERCVPPVAIATNDPTRLLVYRGQWVGPEELSIKPFTGDKYEFFIVNTALEIMGECYIGTGRVIGQLPEFTKK